VLLELGTPQRAIFPRSTNKPLQAAIMLELGLDLPAELLAVACGSHIGLPMHVDAVREILARSGLTEADLANTPSLPDDPDAAKAVLAAGGGPDRLHQNCSGNHAAMLATCVAAGWPTAGYLDPAHPLQLKIHDGYEQMAGTPMGAVAVDGCGAPLYAVSLVGLARAYLGLAAAVLAGADDPQARVAAAMTGFPDLVDGPGRPASGLMAALPGLLAKSGAEGVFAAALPDGRSIALKIDDGAMRACVPVLVAALRELGLDRPGFERFATSPIFGHGRAVGEVRAAAFR
jgi:L-asparaginase II